MRRQPAPEARSAPRSLRAFAFLLLALQAITASTDEAAILLPPGLNTFADGRKPIQTLYESYLALLERGWMLDIVADSRPSGTTDALPIVALLSPSRGHAVWFLAGIHGEEPAGPNAIAEAIGDIARLGEKRPVVLLPLLNPQGYARNWRYLNISTYSDGVEGQSVGDSSHLLPSAEEPGRPRAAAASSPEADAVTRYVLRRSADYPPLYSIDLHEDNLIDEGYVYSQGALGAGDALAILAVGVLREHCIPIKMSGETRFGEAIHDGVIGPVIDGSIDELMSSRQIVSAGGVRPGPAAGTVLVFETPAGNASLERRIAAHTALIRRLAAVIGAMDN